MPHKFYHGLNSHVWNVTKRAIGAEINKQGMDYAPASQKCRLGPVPETAAQHGFAVHEPAAGILRPRATSQAGPRRRSPRNGDGCQRSAQESEKHIDRLPCCKRGCQQGDR